MPGRRFTHGVRRGARRQTSWVAIAPVETTADAASRLISTLNAAALAKRPFTIIRTHLTIHVVSDQQIATEGQLVGVGMAVVSDQATAIGITAIPTPITDLGSDLFYLHQLVMTQFVFGSAIGFDADSGRQIDVDSKAMRKVNDDQDIVLVADFGVVGEGSALTTAGRFLIKEG